MPLSLGRLVHPKPQAILSVNEQQGRVARVDWDSCLDDVHSFVLFWLYMLPSERFIMKLMIGEMGGKLCMLLFGSRVLLQVKLFWRTNAQLVWIGWTKDETGIFTYAMALNKMDFLGVNTCLWRYQAGSFLMCFHVQQFSIVVPWRDRFSFSSCNRLCMTQIDPIDFCNVAMHVSGLFDLVKMHDIEYILIYW
jgi:hypothetical protein